MNHKIQLYRNKSNSSYSILHIYKKITSGKDSTSGVLARPRNDIYGQFLIK
jgi:hypothetical protein